jgi:ankyrin repeat protein
MAIKNDDVDYVRKKAHAFDLKNDKNSEGMNVVGHAAHHGSFEVFKLLTRELGARQDEGDTTWDQRPLFRAAKGDTSAHLKIVKLLVANEDVDKNAREKDGQTALAVAASCGNLEVVEVLLNAHADPTLRDRCSPARTALSRARAKLKAASTEPPLAKAAKMLRFQQVINLLERCKSQLPNPEEMEAPGYIAEPARKRDRALAYFESYI